MGRDVMCEATSDWGYPVACQFVWAQPVWAVPAGYMKESLGSTASSSLAQPVAPLADKMPTSSSVQGEASRAVVGCSPQEPATNMQVQSTAPPMCMSDACTTGQLGEHHAAPDLGGQVVWVPSATHCIASACQLGESGPATWGQSGTLAMFCMPRACQPEELAQRMHADSSLAPSMTSAWQQEALEAAAGTSLPVCKRGRRPRHSKRNSRGERAECAAPVDSQQLARRVEEEEDHRLVADSAQMILKLSAAGDERRVAFEDLRAAFAHLAWGAQGCRVAQDALDAVDRTEQAVLAMELRGRVREALESPHANFVVQKMIEVMSPAAVTFIVEELTGAAVETAQHRYGCRAICRLLEHCPHAQTRHLIDEILMEATSLCRHSYGHYIIQHVLEFGTPEQKGAVVQTLVEDALGFASHRCGSSVVEHALGHSGHEDRQALLHALLRDSSSFAQLASTRYGSYVARTLVHATCTGGEGADACALITAALPNLLTCKHGKRVVAEIKATSVAA